MSIPTLAAVLLSLSSTRNSSASQGGGLTADAEIDIRLEDGVAAEQGRINREWAAQDAPVAAGPGFVLNMVGAPAPPDAAFSLALLRLLFILADPANTSFVQIDPTSSGTGWDTTFTADVVLNPGDLLLFVSETGSLVDGVARDLVITGNDQNLSEVVILGATA